VFFDVGNELNTNADPTDASFPVIDIAESNNVSWSDVFKRKENADFERVAISSDARIIASESGDRIRLGQLAQESTIDVNVPIDTSTVEVATIDVSEIDSFDIRYRIKIPSVDEEEIGGVKSGILSITKDFSGTTPIYNDEYAESGDTRGFYFIVEQQETIVASTVIDEIVISFSTASSGSSQGTFRYSLSYFD